MIFSCPAKAKLIDFTIGGVPYQAEEGMTWEQWVDSQFNIGEFYVSGTLIYKRNVSGFVINSSSIPVSPTETIIGGTFVFDAGRT